MAHLSWHLLTTCFRKPLPLHRTHGRTHGSDTRECGVSLDEASIQVMCLLTHGDVCDATDSVSSFKYNKSTMHYKRFVHTFLLRNTCWILLDTLHPTFSVLHVYSHSCLGSAPCSSDCLVSIHRLQMCPDFTSLPNSTKPLLPSGQSHSADTPVFNLLLKCIFKWQLVVMF